MVTINVSKELHKKLEDYKIYSRETYEDVIKRAIDGELHPDDPDSKELTKVLDNETNVD